MTRKSLQLAAATAALLLAAPGVQAGTLVAAHHVGDVSAGIGFFSSDLAPISTFAIPDPAVGLAYRAGSLYVAGDTTFAQYNLLGTQLAGFGDPGGQFGPTAFGDGKVFFSYETFAGASVSYLNPDLSGTLVFPGFPQLPDGISFGDDTLFVGYGSTLERLDMSGAHLYSASWDPLVQFGPMAYGDGHLYLSYENQGVFGIFSVNPLTFASDGYFATFTATRARGLVFGDDAVFASFEDEIVKYSANGLELGSLYTGGLVGGPLAYIPNPPRPGGGAVPEPSAWALMILGFGGVGATLRVRRRLPPAAAA